MKYKKRVTSHRLQGVLHLQGLSLSTWCEARGQSYAMLQNLLVGRNQGTEGRGAALRKLVIQETGIDPCCGALEEKEIVTSNAVKPFNKGDQR